MKRTIFISAAILGCVSATRVPAQFIPILVVMSLGIYLLVIGLLSSSSTRVDDEMAEGDPLDVMTTGVFDRASADGAR
jgi:hypothetical protein